MKKAKTLWSKSRIVLLSSKNLKKSMWSTPSSSTPWRRLSVKEESNPSVTSTSPSTTKQTLVIQTCQSHSTTSSTSQRTKSTALLTPPFVKSRSKWTCLFTNTCVPKTPSMISNQSWSTLSGLKTTIWIATLPSGRTTMPTRRTYWARGTPGRR